MDNERMVKMSHTKYINKIFVPIAAVIIFVAAHISCMRKIR